MAINIVYADSKDSKVSRSIRLDAELDAQLLTVCKGLGVTPNAYLKQVVGEAINKHMAQYRLEKNMTQAITDQIEKMMVMMAADKSNSD